MCVCMCVCVCVCVCVCAKHSLAFKTNPTPTPNRQECDQGVRDRYQKQPSVPTYLRVHPVHRVHLRWPVDHTGRTQRLVGQGTHRHTVQAETTSTGEWTWRGRVCMFR